VTILEPATLVLRLVMPLWLVYPAMQTRTESPGNSSKVTPVNTPPLDDTALLVS
jgi:hypothetical protein